jgi:NADPH-dependent 2,4-dienoyl-CoA reductase/sulfur reductase-like enzyme/rhodanese-related sulfurtransferase
VGGIAGGASAIARARRLDEFAHIILFEQDSDVSVGTCGMPYAIGGKIAREKLLVMGKSELSEWFDLDLRIRSRVTKIDRQRKVVTVFGDGKEYEESYDTLILATGARAVRPNIDGLDEIEASGDGERNSVHYLRSLASMDRIVKALGADARGKKVTCVGGGFVGLELCEQLVERGCDVTLVERAPHVLPSLDAEMTTPVRAALEQRGVRVLLNQSVTRMKMTADGDDGSGAGATLYTDAGNEWHSELTVLSVGVRPASELAVDAGLAVAPNGAVVVDDHMASVSDASIYACGDLVQTRDWVPRDRTYVPLAGPANRQARIAADNACGRGNSTYRGTQGSSIVSVFGVVAAATGASERLLRAKRFDYDKVLVFPSNHAGYYEGASPIAFKLLFEVPGGRILGAQAIGKQGVDKRIDVISMAIQASMTVFDLEEAELCYAPQFSSAKDPANMCGFVASGVLRGDQVQMHVPDFVEHIDQFNVIDVRHPHEYDAGHIPTATNISLNTLRARLPEIDAMSAERPLAIYCRSGMRGYVACRLLRQRGYNAINLSGGYLGYQLYHN